MRTLASRRALGPQGSSHRLVDEPSPRIPSQEMAEKKAQMDKDYSDMMGEMGGMGGQAPGGVGPDEQRVQSNFAPPETRSVWSRAEASSPFSAGQTLKRAIAIFHHPFLGAKSQQRTVCTGQEP